MSIGGALLGFGVLGAFFYRSSLKLETAKEKKQLAGAFAVIVMLGLFIGTGRRTQADDYFRNQFQLPAGAEIVEMTMPRKGSPLRAVYRIPDAHWQAFLAGLNTASTPFLFRFPADPVHHARIARWKALPPPMQAADAPKHLLDIPRVYDFAWDYRVRNGRMLCIVYVAMSSAGARACENSTKGDPLYAFAVGMIDFDLKLVHMHVRDNSGGFRLF